MPLVRAKGTVGMALVAYRVWRRLPPSQKALILSHTRKHGPKAAAALAALLRSKRRR
jgi:hypothetical protein